MWGNEGGVDNFLKNKIYNLTSSIIVPYMGLNVVIKLKPTIRVIVTN